jgi:DNA-binding transcriptional regulator YhcF (GntR family)
MSVDDLVTTILSRIAGGQYRLHAKLPTCKELAEELGTNKNTVNKAYQLLVQQGYLQAQVRRGTHVIKRPPTAIALRSEARIRKLLEQVSYMARAAGITSNDLLETAARVAHSIYKDDKPVIACVECNERDAKALGNELAQAIGFGVRPFVIGEFFRALENRKLKWDFVIVNLTHLVEVEEGLEKRNIKRSFTIVPVFVPPSSESLAAIARLAVGTKVGIVCATDGALSTLTGVVKAMNAHLVVRNALATDVAKVKEIARTSDALMISAAARYQLPNIRSKAVIYPVSFKLEESEAQRVGNLVATFLARRATAA